MAAISNYAIPKMMDHIFGKTTWTLPSDGSRCWIALLTAAPSASSTGATITEPSGNAYARLSTTAADWNAASGGSISNANDLTWPEATGTWGTIGYFALVDNATVGAGNVLAYGTFTTSRTITNGVTAKIAAGAFVFSFTTNNTISNVLRNAIVAMLVGKAQYSAPTIYIGLATADPAVTTAGNALTGEPSSNGYARLVTAGSDWSANSAGETHNSGVLTMAEGTGSWSSGSAMATVVLLDASSSGNVLMWGDPANTKTYTIYDTPIFKASDLSFTLS